MLTIRQQSVLSMLEAWGMSGLTTSAIARDIGAPEPSIRRTIQELIRLGHNISYASDGLYYYRKGY